MTRDLKSQLKALQHHQAFRPEETWVGALKDELARIPATSAVPHAEASWVKRAADLVSFVVPKNVFTGARLTAVYVAVFGLAAYGWSVSVSAAQTSLPGDILYNVKKANEKTELFFAGSKSDEKVAVLLDHASRRADELKQIQALPENDSSKAERTKTVVNSLKKNIVSTNEEIAKAKIDKTVDPVVLVSVVSEKISKLSSNLGTALTTGTSTPEATNLSSEVASEVVAMAALAEETKVHAVVTAVERTADTTVPVEATADVVAKTLGQTLTSLETTLLTYEAAASSTPTGTLPLAAIAPVATVSMTVSTTAGTVSSSSVIPAIAVVTGTTTVSSTVSSTPPVVPAISLEVQVHAVGAILSDARALLAQENIRGAVEKMQAAVSALKVIQPQFAPDVTVRAYATLSTPVSSSDVSTQTTASSTSATSTVITPVESVPPSASMSTTSSHSVAPTPQ